MRKGRVERDGWDRRDAKAVGQLSSEYVLERRDGRVRAM